MVMELTRQSDNRRFTGLLMIPSDCPGSSACPQRRVIRASPGREVLRHYLGRLFPGTVKNPGFFQLFRDSDIELAEGEDLVRLFGRAQAARAATGFDQHRRSCARPSGCNLAR